MTTARYTSPVALTARQIRKDLKAAGIAPRAVSVRSSNYSLGSSISVEIKDPSIALDTVQAIATKHQSVARCEVTGETLNGGNTYVSVSYDSDAIAPFVDALTSALEAFPTVYVGGFRVSGLDDYDARPTWDRRVALRAEGEEHGTIVSPGVAARTILAAGGFGPIVSEGEHKAPEAPEAVEAAPDADALRAATEAAEVAFEAAREAFEAARAAMISARSAEIDALRANIANG